MTKAELIAWLKTRRYGAQVYDPSRGSFIPAAERKP